MSHILSSRLTFWILVVAAMSVPGGKATGEETIEDRVNIVGGDTPTLRLDQDGTSAFTPQVWDVAGNETGFFIRDVTNSNRLPFRIRRGASTNSLVINGNDRIGMGTTSPSGRLHIMADGVADASDVLIDPGSLTNASLELFEDMRSAEVLVRAGDTNRSAVLRLRTPVLEFSVKSSSQGKFVVRDEANGRNVITIFPSTLNNNIVTIRNGNLGVARGNPTFPLHMASGARCTAGGVWTNACSRKLKDEIEPLNARQARDAFAKLQPVTYHYKADPLEKHVGFISEDVPELLAVGDRTGLAAMDVVAVLTRVVQQQEQELAQQQKKLLTLQEQNRKQADLSAKLLKEINSRLSSLEDENRRLAEFNK